MSWKDQGFYPLVVVTWPSLPTHHVRQCFFDVPQDEELFTVQESVVVEVAGILALLQGAHPAVADSNPFQFDVNSA